MVYYNSLINMKTTGKNFIVLQEVDSTNNYAKQLIVSKAAEEGTVVLAYHQEQGRGQMGNRWESEKDKNLTFSIILYPDFLSAADQFLLSEVISLGIFDFISSQVEGVKIKWPNDMYVGDKKIAGILIENSVMGNSLFSSVAGIGININQNVFLSGAPNPVSLKQLTGKTYILEELAEKVTDSIFIWYKKLRSGQSEVINATYISNLFRRGEWSVFREQNRTFEARIVGIGEFGRLLTEDRSGKITGYMFKEVEFVI